MEKMEKFRTQFIDDKYKVADNPITNPVDIKIAKDNPYIIKELLGRRNSQLINSSNNLLMDTQNKNIKESKNIN